jgi:hypothetical protein
METGLVSFSSDSSGRSWEHDNEPSDSIIGGEFLDYTEVVEISPMD